MKTDNWTTFAEIEAHLGKDYFEISRYILDEDLELKTITGVVGVDFGRPIEVLMRRKYYALAKIPSHPTWAGVGSRRLQNTEYLILELGLVDDEIEPVFVFKILDRDEPGRYWKSLVTKFTARIEKLAMEI